MEYSPSLKGDILPPSSTQNTTILTALHACIDRDNDSVRTIREFRRFLSLFVTNVTQWISQSCTPYSCPSINLSCSDMNHDGALTQEDIRIGIEYLRTLLRCGNGRIDASEQCDDGNTANEDGCNTICLNEQLPEITSVFHNGALRIVKKSPMPAIVQTMPVAYHGNLYLVGGILLGSNEQGPFFQYNPRTNTWIRLGSLLNDLYSGLYNVGAGVLNDSIIKLGGDIEGRKTWDMALWNDIDQAWVKQGYRNREVTIPTNLHHTLEFDNLLFSFQSQGPNNNAPGTFIYTDEVSQELAWSLVNRQMGYDSYFPSWQPYSKPVVFQRQLWYPSSCNYLWKLEERSAGGRASLFELPLPEIPGYKNCASQQFLFVSQGKLWHWTYFLKDNDQSVRTFALHISSTEDGITWTSRIMKPDIPIEELPRYILTLDNDVYMLDINDDHTFFARVLLPE